MDAKNFYDAVCIMRKAQVKYRYTGSYFDLEEAKKKEKVVDDEIKRVEKIREGKRQSELF